MTRIGKFEVSDKLAPFLEVKEDTITIEDFEGNEEVFYWFQEMEEIAAKHEENFIEPIEESDKKS